MRQDQKNYLRDLLVAFLVSLSLINSKASSKNLNLKIGESTELSIDSDEQMKVKGASIHVVDLKENHYQIIAVKKGIAVIDPTPLSRSRPPIIVEVVTNEDNNQELSCVKLRLICKQNEISGEINDLNQLTFLDSQDTDLKDFTVGKISSDSSEILKRWGILSIQKVMGWKISISLKCSDGNENNIRSFWKHFDVQLVCERSKNRRAVFSFEIEKVDDELKNSKSLATNFFLNSTNRDGVEKKTISYAEKSLLISEGKMFGFRVESRNQNQVGLHFSMQGKIDFSENTGQGSFAFEGGSSSANDKGRSEIQLPYEKKILISESEASDQLSENFSLTPWSQIPIIGIIFKRIARAHSKLKQKIYILLSNETI